MLINKNRIVSDNYIYIHIFNINKGLNIGYQNINQQSKTQLPNPEYDCFTCRTKCICVQPCLVVSQKL